MKSQKSKAVIEPLDHFVDDTTRCDDRGADDGNADDTEGDDTAQSR